MGIKFATIGNQVNVYDLNEETFSDFLKPRVYTLEYSPSSGFYLRIFKAKFDTPKRLYGSIKKRARKVIDTYKSRVNSTGVLLTGNKGSGKTMVSEYIANQMINDGKAVILINQNFNGQSFTNFINMLGECVLFFDEFGKTFETQNNPNSNRKNNDQNELLTLMDGTSSLKRMFLLTENEKRNINEYMIDRPSRIYYHFKYNTLEESIVHEYCDDFKIPDDKKYEIIEVSRQISQFSFDILKCIVDEYLRYGGTITNIVQDLNITYKETKFELVLEKFIEKETNKELKTKTKTIDYEDDKTFEFNVIYYPQPNQQEDLLPESDMEGIFDRIDEPVEEGCDSTWFRRVNLTYNMRDNMVFDNKHYIVIGSLQEKTVKFDYKSL